MSYDTERVERYSQMIQENRDDQTAIVTIPNVLVHCTLPQSDPGPAKTWARSQNGVRIIVHPYEDWTGVQTGVHGCPQEPLRLYPFGSISRCLFFTVGWEAMLKQTPKLMMKGIFEAFRARFNIRTTNKRQRTRIMDHMMRLFRCRIEFRKDTSDSGKWRNFQITDEGYLAWDDTNFSGRLTKDSYIVLSQSFYQALMLHPIPVDMRAIQALRHSALCLDVYSWSTFTTFLITFPQNGMKPEAQLFSWKELANQFGCDYGRDRDFKRKFPHVLREVHQVYPELTVELLDEGLKVYPARPAVLPQPKGAPTIAT